MCLLCDVFFNANKSISSTNTVHVFIWTAVDFIMKSQIADCRRERLKISGGQIMAQGPHTACASFSGQI